MLAAAADYFQVWQLPVILVLIVGWLVGGGYLFLLGLRNVTESKRVKFGRGILLSFLSGLIGAMAGVALLWLGQVLLPPTGKFPISKWGVGMASLGYLFMGYFIVFAMNKLSAKETLRLSAPPLLATLIGGGIILGTCAWFAHKSVIIDRRYEGYKGETMIRLDRIYRTIERRGPSKPPENLQVLVEEKLVQEDAIKSPAKPKGPGFFYVPSPLDLRRTEENKKILACDYRANFGDRGRTVLFTDGSLRFYQPSGFARLLRDPDNQAFAEALKQAEGE
jgi:hypothetical protein